MRPQNYFDELPWHARWDTARSLLNRVFTGDPTFPVGDFPGTLAVRRERLPRQRRLRRRRAVREPGADADDPRRRGKGGRPRSTSTSRGEPPSTAHFLSQRVRQAYDDFAIPARLVRLPRLGPAGGRSWCGAVAVAGCSSAALASVASPSSDARRAGGAGGSRSAARCWRRPGSRSARSAPGWPWRQGCGAGFATATAALRHSATSMRRLRRRYSVSPPALGGPQRQAALGLEADRLVSPVAEGADSVSGRSGRAPPPAFDLDLVAAPGRRSRRGRGSR